MSAPIATQYELTFQAFEELCTLLQKPGYPYSDQISSPAVRDELGRFKVWAGNIGAHQHGHISLDYRLRDASHIQRQVILLLEDLHEALGDAVLIITGRKTPHNGESSDSESSDAGSAGETPSSHRPVPKIQQWFLDVVEIITCLFKISIAIRSPAPHDRLIKSARIRFPHFESFDIKHAVEKFPNSDRDLTKRLGLANTKRREHFEYRKRHHEKLMGKGKTAEPDIGNVAFAEIRKTAPSAIATTAYTQTTAASTLYQSGLMRELENAEVHSETGQSQTSYTPSVADDDQHMIEVPPLPREASDEKPFECPYCFTICIFKGGRTWRNHVFKDLQPYVCTFEGCLTSHTMFATRREWLNHELCSHRREWFCSLCNEIFKTKAECKCHMVQHHSGGLMEDQMSALVDMCERPVKDIPVAACPLCDWETIWKERRAAVGQEPFSDTVMVTSKVFGAHVGRHLEQLALFALPKICNDEASDIESDKAVGSSEGPRYTLSSTSDKSSKGEASLILVGPSKDIPYFVASESLLGGKRSKEPGHPDRTSRGVSDSLGLSGTTHEVPVPIESQGVVIIALMGATGTGKSSFINKAAGASLEVSHGLEPCTVSAQRVEFTLDGREIILIEYPGFGDTNHTDIELLETIGLHLQQGSKMKMFPTGIIYMQRIMDNRMSGGSLRGLRILQKLCGAENYAHLALVTSQWDVISDSEGEQREKQLCAMDEYWGEMIRSGATVNRYSNSEESAIKILRQFLSKRPIVLQFQEEFKVHGIVSKTTAGMEIVRPLLVKLENCEKRTKELIDENEKVKTDVERLKRDREGREIEGGFLSEDQVINKAKDKMEGYMRALEKEVNMVEQDEQRVRSELWMLEKPVNLAEKRLRLLDCTTQ